MSDEMLFMACIFLTTGLLAYGIARLAVSKQGVKLRERLAGPVKVLPQTPKPRAATFREWLERFGAAAASPFMPEAREKQSALRQQLAQAGIYHALAVKIFVGCKFILLASGAAIGYTLGMAMDHAMLGLSFGGLTGYVAPGIWLRLEIAQNKRDLEYALPDALDLMVVCVEAGLTIDSAMQRVGEELTLVHPRLSRELELTHLETRVGLSRSQALRNLGQRTNSAPLQALAAMLIQADRFGTSIATALRQHAEGIRLARQHKAEELAAKASVKLSFPLVLFIFPATFIVLAGPPMIGLFTSALFND